MHALLPFVTILALLVAPAPLAAAQPTSLEAAVADAWASDEAGLKVLRTSGAAVGPVLVAERVPSGAYVVEVAVRLGPAQLRYPLKFEFGADGWQLVWQPATTYAGALLGIAKSGALPAGRGDAPWGGLTRLPALPVVATRARVVTPFGEVTAEDLAPAQGLPASPPIVAAGQRWITTVLEDDPAPAGIDLLLDRSSSWRGANVVLLSLAAAGLYQVHVVTAEFGSIRVASPVTRPADVVVALYELEQGFGARVSASGNLLEGDGCAPEMSACLGLASELGGVLGRLDQPARSVMFAATGDVSVADAIDFLVATQEYFGLPPHRLLLGYVQR